MGKGFVLLFAERTEGPFETEKGIFPTTQGVLIKVVRKEVFNILYGSVDGFDVHCISQKLFIASQNCVFKIEGSKRKNVRGREQV